ncbi:spinster family MFS transporter [Sphingosinicella terrae]|uniref:spinster family MFS transporter n=1 Tax=Sphingosinicella terrae TaxID=2172047 RepID=UPI000E0DEB75|nr:MFS transporter [Sphingosinicella terrae]
MARDDPGVGGEPSVNGAATPEPRRGAGLLVFFLFLAYLLAYYDRLITVVLSETIKSEFALSDKAVSLINGGSFVAIYGVGGVLSGWLIDRYSRKHLLAASLVLWSATTVLCGFATSFVQLALARAGVGVGESAIVPLALSTISDATPKARRPMAMAIFYSGGMVGLFISFVAGSWIGATYGWRMAFYVAGPPGILLALLVLVFAREPEREPPPEPAPGEARAAGSWSLITGNRPLIWLLLGGALATFGNMGMMQWLPLFFIRSHGLSLAEVGLYFGPAMAGGMAAGMLLGGWIGNRVAQRNLSDLIRFSALILILVIPLYLTVLTVPSMPVALGTTFVATALSVLYSPSYTAAMQTVCDPRVRGITAGVSNLANSIIGGAVLTFMIGVASDLLVPSLGEESLRYALSGGLAICAVAALCFIRSVQHLPAPIR